MENKKIKEGNGYLKLIRSVGERITVGEDMEITVEEVYKNKVKLGISAPKDVVILRDNAKIREPKYND